MLFPCKMCSTNGSDNHPIEIVLPLSSARHPNTRPPNSTAKRPVGMFTNYILLSISPLLMLTASTSTRLPAPFSCSLLSRSCQASIFFGRIGRSLKASWSQEAGSAVRERRRARSEARRSDLHRLRYIDASCRASSVIFRAKSATWQATSSNLSPRFDPRVLFRFLNAISGKKNTS